MLASFNNLNSIFEVIDCIYELLTSHKQQKIYKQLLELISLTMIFKNLAISYSKGCCYNSINCLR